MHLIPKDALLQGADIVYLLKKAGHPSARVAEELRVTLQTVSSVIYGIGRSARVASRIAEILGTTPHEIWPDKYPPPDAESIEEEEESAQTWQ